MCGGGSHTLDSPPRAPARPRWSPHGEISRPILAPSTGAALTLSSRSGQDHAHRIASCPDGHTFSVTVSASYTPVHSEAGPPGPWPRSSPCPNCVPQPYPGPRPRHTQTRIQGRAWRSISTCPFSDAAWTESVPPPCTPALQQRTRQTQLPRLFWSELLSSLERQLTASATRLYNRLAENKQD